MTSNQGKLQNTELDLAEALRWCWRHRGVLDFDFEEGDGCPRIMLVTPLRHPEGDVDRVSMRCSTQVMVEDLVVDMVGQVRERLNLE